MPCGINTIKGKGVLQGTTILDTGTKAPKCHRFSRVPYAIPPIASRRWRKPEPLQASFSYGSESEPGRYTEQPLMCPQLNEKLAQNAGYSEDCLQLNIWVPTGEAPEKGWPVLFYIRELLLWTQKPIADETQMEAFFNMVPTMARIHLHCSPRQM